MSNRPRWIVALALLAGAGGLIAVFRLLPGADAGRSSPPAGLATCATVPALGPGAAARPGTFFKIQPRLDAAGTLVGRQLFVGRAGQSTGSMELPAESSVSGPIDGIVTVAADDGSHSTVQLVSATDGCASVAFTATSVIRRAIANPIDGSLLLHFVDGATRADLGVWRLASTGAEPVLILEPLPAALGFGTVWATDLRLDPVGRQLAVQSCQDRECLTRIVDLAAPEMAAIVLRGTRQGPTLGFAGDRLVTWAACDGFPCSVLAWDAASAGLVELLANATAAGLTADGRLLVATLSDGALDHAVVIDLVSGRTHALRGLAAGDRPVATGGIAAMGLEVAPDQLAVAQPAGDPHAIRPTAAGEVLP
jgi:hypothetical protein